MTATDKTREALARVQSYLDRRIIARGLDLERIHCFDNSTDLLASDLQAMCNAIAASATAEVVVTKNPAGAIVAVTRQDADGRVIEVIAEAAPSQQSAEVQALPCAIGARVEGARVIVTASGGNDGARRLCEAIVAMIEADKQANQK